MPCPAVPLHNFSFATVYKHANAMGPMAAERYRLQSTVLDLG